MRSKKETVTAPELHSGPARLTGWGWLWILIYLGLPAMVLGLLMDFLTQTLTGWCVGIWCIFD
jgi:hypothetical protein